MHSNDKDFEPSNRLTQAGQHNKNSVKKLYQRRVKQRHIYFVVGTRLALISIILFVVGLVIAFIGVPFKGTYFLLSFGILGASFGAIFSTIFGTVGWSRFRWLDLLLNQISVLLALFGFIAWIGSQIYRNDNVFLLGLLLILVGVALAILGIRFHSPVENNEAFANDSVNSESKH